MLNPVEYGHIYCRSIIGLTLRNRCYTSIYARLRKLRSPEQEFLYLKLNDSKFYAFYKKWKNNLFSGLISKKKSPTSPGCSKKAAG